MRTVARLNMKIAFILCGLLAVAHGRTIEDNTFFNSRIVNGEDAELGERPYQVSLQYISHFCGGSILNEYWVVTAAHCVQGQEIHTIDVEAGSVSNKESYSSHQVERVIIHEAYNPKDSYVNDIALIKVTTPFEFSFRIQPVDLPEPHVNVKTNSTAVVSGWGLNDDNIIPERLQKTTYYIADQDFCRDAAKSSDMNVYSTQICTHDPSARRGECNGDSGGPVTVDGKLVGIVSWSIKDPGCGNPKYPGIHTRVSEYVDWIHQHIQ